MSTFYNAPEHRAFTLGAGERRALLVHGFPGTPAELHPLARFFAAAGWQVRVPLCPASAPALRRSVVNAGKTGLGPS